MEEHYSKIYQTEKGKYRYNYSTGKLEHIANQVQMVLTGQRKVPVVELGVVDCIKMNRAKFDSCPEYWVELYESVLERLIRR